MHREWHKYFYRSLLCVLAFCVVFSVAANASDTSPWITGSNHSITEEGFSSNDDYDSIMADHRGYDQGQECLYRSIQIRPKILLSPAIYKDGCWYMTSIGLLHQDGKYLLMPKYSTAAHIKGDFLDQSILKPTTNPDVFLDLKYSASTGYGHTLKFRTLVDLEFNINVSLNGTITIEYARPATAIFENEKQYTPTVLSADVWYSADAKHMYIWKGRGVLYHINLENFNILAINVFERPSNTITGSIAASPSGRHIALTTENWNKGNIYIIDTANCDQTESKNIGTTANCSVTAQRDLLAEKISDFTYPYLPLSLIHI